MTDLRLRQLVFASNAIEDIARLKEILDLGDGFVDPGVAEFGLTNGVFALGDQFLELVVPVQDQTAAGRFLARSNGIGGYMVIFQTDDLNAVRARADAQRIRRVWNIDLPDISASHLHPADIGAAIVSIDEARPPSSWRWGGPDWPHQTLSGGLFKLEISASDPQAMSAKWAVALGQSPVSVGHDVYEFATADGPIRFVPGARDYLSVYGLDHPAPEACLARADQHGLACDDTSFLFAGVRVQLKSD